MIFAWTDEWFRGGCEIEDWDFGLTRRNREPKPALTAVAQFLKQPLPQPTWCPKVSVVVCSFNGARTIRDCLDGLCRLDYPNYEIIVVNDGSTDGTADIARGYPCRLISTENCGLSSARNTGIKEAKGEIIAYLDDDAWPDPHWLTYLVPLFENTTHAGVGDRISLPPVRATCLILSPTLPVDRSTFCYLIKSPSTFQDAIWHSQGVPRGHWRFRPAISVGGRRCGRMLAAATTGMDSGISCGRHGLAPSP